jgi:hypothetical protein
MIDKIRRAFFTEGGICYGGRKIPCNLEYGMPSSTVGWARHTQSRNNEHCLQSPLGFESSREEKNSMLEKNAVLT